jgi:hypothetical protein
VATPGRQWAGPTQVAPAGTTYSAPAIYARSSGEVDIVAVGPNNSLIYYLLTPGVNFWRSYQLAGSLSAYSAPAIFVRDTDMTPAGEADVVVQGPDYSLVYYWAQANANWQSMTIDGPMVAYSSPSIVVRGPTSTPEGEADIVVEGPGNSLNYYSATPGQPWTQLSPQIAGPGTTFSAPSIVVRSISPTNEIDVVAQGPNNAIMYYYHPDSSWLTYQMAVPGADNLTFGPPAFLVEASGRADIVAQGPKNSLDFYYALPGYPFTFQQIGSAIGAAYAPPGLFARGTGEVDVVAVGPANALQYFYWLGNDWSQSTIVGSGTTF